MTFGLSNAQAISCAPAWLSTYSVFVHVFPPSVLRNTPRMSMSLWTFPCAAISTRLGSFGSTRIDGICFVSSSPRCCHVLAGVDGLVHAVAFVDAAAGDEITHADVDDVRIGRRDLHGADRRRFLHRIENRIPRRAGARGLPDAAERQSDVEGAGLTDHAGDGRDATAAERADHAPLQASEEARLEWRGGGEREQAGQQSSAGEPSCGGDS